MFILSRIAMRVLLLTVTLGVILPSTSNGFTINTRSNRVATLSSYQHEQQYQRQNSILKMGDDAVKVEVVTDDDDDEEEVEPGKLRVSEIKAELDMRGIDYVDCFDKESLAQRLEEARATGKANPKIIDNFNKQKLEETFNEQKLEVKDEDIDRIKANDGTLPGGMDPEMFKSLVGNPEIMALMQSPKMQDAMKLMMGGGPQDLEKAMADDPELLELVQKLNSIMSDTLK